jgi:hypothetical protein
MSNRWFRFGIAVLAIAVAGAAGYRIQQQEKRLAADAAAARIAAAAAERALIHVSEIKAALHAYVAAGQGHAFWTGRAAMLIDALRAAVLEVDAAASAAGAATTSALDPIDQLAATEQRARDHVRASEALMASDIIFTEGRDQLDALRIRLAGARDEIARTFDARHATLRREEVVLAAAAAGLMALAVLVLVPIGRPPARASTAPLSVTTAVSDEETIGYGPGVRTARTPDVTPPRTAVDTLRPASVRAVSEAPGVERPSVAATTAAPAPLPSVSLPSTARLCTDLAKIEDSAQLSGLLDRAADVLGASGIIVWMTSPDTGELYPVAASGYDARLLARVGSISRDDANLTAAAFRDGSVKTSEKAGSSAAALAAPLVGPAGAVGVLSAELREVGAVDDQRQAVAAIFAAQLAAVLSSGDATAASASDVPSAQVKA